MWKTRESHVLITQSIQTRWLIAFSQDKDLTFSQQKKRLKSDWTLTVRRLKCDWTSPKMWLKGKVKPISYYTKHFSWDLVDWIAQVYLVDFVNLTTAIWIWFWIYRWSCLLWFRELYASLVYCCCTAKHLQPSHCWPLLHQVYFISILNPSNLYEKTMQLSV